MTAEVDLAALAALHAECFRNPRPWSASELADLVDSQGTQLLTEPGGFLVGRAVAGEAEVLTLAVAPARRRHGIAGRLLRAFLTSALGEGAETVFLEVAADNAAALALYRKHGFAEAGRRRGYYRDQPGAAVDALVLRRGLSVDPPKI